LLSAIALPVCVVVGLSFELVELSDSSLNLLQLLVGVRELMHDCGLRSLEFIESFG